MKGWKITPFQYTWDREFHFGPFGNWGESFDGQVDRIDFEVGIELGPYILGFRIRREICP